MVTKQKFVVCKDGTIRGVTPVSKRVQKAQKEAKRERSWTASVEKKVWWPTDEHGNSKRDIETPSQRKGQ